MMTTFPHRVRLAGGVLLLSMPAFAHRGHGHSAAWQACSEASLGQVCAFEDAEHALYRGTCRSMSDDLMCVRNQPIVPAGPVAAASLALPARAGAPAAWWIVVGGAAAAISLSMAGVFVSLRSRGG